MSAKTIIYLWLNKLKLKSSCDKHTQNHVPHAHSQENKDYQYVTTQPRTLHYAVSHQTKDIMWLGAIQWTEDITLDTFNRGHALNGILASFSSSYTPLNRGPSAVSCISSVSCEISHVSSFDTNYPCTQVYNEKRTSKFLHKILHVSANIITLKQLT